MNEAELLKRLTQGEYGRHRFKRDATNADSLAAELAAFANSGGGTLFIGVNDDGSVTGLDTTDIRRLNQLLSNASPQPRSACWCLPTGWRSSARATCRTT